MSDENAVSTPAPAAPTPEAKKAEAEPVNELKTLQQAAKAIEKVDCPKARHRIVQWLMHKFGCSGFAD